MDHNLKANRRPDLNACACTSRVLARIGRALLILTAISLITMPVTQHLWTWDRFLYGGRDFELSSLMTLSILGLVLVLSKYLKQCVESLLSELCTLGFVCQERTPIRISCAFPVANDHVAVPDEGTYNTPLLI